MVIITHLTLEVSEEQTLEAAKQGLWHLEQGDWSEAAHALTVALVGWEHGKLSALGSPRHLGKPPLSPWSRPPCKVASPGSSKPSLPGQALQEPHLLEALADTYQGAGAASRAAPLYRRACRLRVQLSGVRDPHASLLHHKLVQCLWREGGASSTTALDAAQDRAQRLHDSLRPDEGVEERDEVLGVALKELAGLHEAAGGTEEALLLHLERERLALKAGGEDGHGTLEVRWQLASAFADLDRHEEALERLEAMLAVGGEIEFEDESSLPAGLTWERIKAEARMVHNEITLAKVQKLGTWSSKAFGATSGRENAENRSRFLSEEAGAARPLGSGEWARRYEERLGAGARAASPPGCALM